MPVFRERLTDMGTDVICIGQAPVDCITRGKQNRGVAGTVYQAEEIRLAAGGGGRLCAAYRRIRFFVPELQICSR